MVEIKVQGSQVFVLGNWMDWYDPETDTILDTCPIFFEEAELLDIDEDRMVIEVSESSRIWEIDGVGNKKLIWPVHEAGGVVIPPLVTKADMARRWGVSRQTVNNWESRHTDFPKPVAFVQYGTFPLYLLRDVEKYEKLRGHNKKDQA